LPDSGGNQNRRVKFIDGSILNFFEKYSSGENIKRYSYGIHTIHWFFSLAMKMKGMRMVIKKTA